MILRREWENLFLIFHIHNATLFPKTALLCSSCATSVYSRSTLRPRAIQGDGLRGVGPVANIST